MPESSSSGSAQPREATVDVPADSLHSLRPAGWTSLLDAALGATCEQSSPQQAWLSEFLAARTVGDALRIALGACDLPSKDRLVRDLNRTVALIDQRLNDQVNAILHHAGFQKLEASWRGLHHLAERAGAEGADPRTLKIRVISVTWHELEKDFEKASEFDQSLTFKKIYGELDTPGADPFGALLLDFEVRPLPSVEHPHQDMSILSKIAQIAAASFAPAFLGTHPSIFDIDDFRSLEYRPNLASVLSRLDRIAWQSLRRKEDARFVGLVLPHVLMRTPYEDDGTRWDRFHFTEDVSGPDCSKYLWGNAVYALGGVLIRAFCQSGWLADIRGVQPGIDGGGLVSSLAVQSFHSDKKGIAVKVSTDVAITDDMERELSELGFITLCHCQDTPWSAFLSYPSLHLPSKFDRDQATENARISAMLHHTLCASRFAHFVKTIVRDKIGSLSEAGELQSTLHDWIMNYVTRDDEASAETKARLPLREADIEVVPSPGKPGTFDCVLRLVPHYQLDDAVASVRLQTQLLLPGRS